MQEAEAAAREQQQARPGAAQPLAGQGHATGWHMLVAGPTWLNAVMVIDGQGAHGLLASSAIAVTMSSQQVARRGCGACLKVLSQLAPRLVSHLRCESQA
jgi:hypothetical protein